MRPLVGANSRMWLYPLYATIGGGVGYWLEGVQLRQNTVLAAKKEMLLEKRRRRLTREEAAKSGTSNSEEEVLVAGG
jgi:hypothetical protein